MTDDAALVAEQGSFLTDDERQRLALVTDVTHDDCFETTTPGTCALDEVVEQIVRDRLTAFAERERPVIKIDLTNDESKWLLDNAVATAKAEALAEARDDIKARIATFRGLNAERMYVNALNDAWGLVANRERAARPSRPAETGPS